MGSSIIFLVVIAIWAVFLLPDLQTRRHQLAQARATNRVLSTSRVLDRDTTPRTQGVEPVTPQTDQAVSAAPDKPAVTASTSTGSTAVTEHATELLDMTEVLAAREAAAETTRRPVGAPRHATPAPTRDNDRTLAWVLAGCLLASLIAVPTTIVLSALSILAWWSVLVALLALAGCVAALRWRATRRRQARKAARVHSVAPTPTPAPVQEDRVIDLRDKPVATVREQESQPQPRRPRQAEVAFDQEQLDEDDDEPAETTPASNGPTAPPTNARPVVDDRPGVWTPPKVPRPTYLMKPRLPQGPLAPPNIGVTTSSSDPFGDLLESGDDDVDLPESRAV